MKCTYCGTEIPAGEEVSGDGHFFCNTIHRYSWKQSGIQHTDAVTVSQPAGSADVVRTGLPRKIIGTIMYSAASYFLLIVVLGALMGGVAGMEAAQNGQDSAEAGRNAGEIFARTYGLFILILCIILSSIGSFKGLLPLTKTSNT